MHFADLGLSKPILRAVEAEGYTTPTPIQAQAIPHALAGRDLLGCAQTGTGKTAAFALPILHRLSTATADKSRRGPRAARALILSPTRELAVQIGESFATYGRDTHLDHTVIFGGVSQMHQERALRRGVDIIVATPGRLLDLMEQRLVDLSCVEVFVLDEADRMLDMGFIDPIRRIAAATPRSPQRQTLLFSATMPATVSKLAHSLLHEPVRVAVDAVSSAAPAIEQSIYMIDRASKQSLLEHLIAQFGAEKIIVFTRTKHGAEKVGRKLALAGIRADTIHGNKNQNQRQRALGRFASGAAQVLVATDVAARGLDVDDITHVFNFDLPVEPEAYVHRIGRTGRAGATGAAISFCDHEERSLLREIERLLGRKLDIRRPEGFIPAPRTVIVADEHDFERPAHRPAKPRRASAPQPQAQAQARTKSRPRPAAATPSHSGGAHANPHHPGGHTPRTGGQRTAHGGWRKPSKRSAPR